MSPILRNLGKIPEETAHVLQNLVSAKGLNNVEHRLTLLTIQYMQLL